MGRDLGVPAYTPQVLRVSGSPYEVGSQIGARWAPVLRHTATLAARDGWVPWWWRGRGGMTAELVERHAPHLVDLYRGVANGAGIDESVAGYDPGVKALQGCTSFGVAGDATSDGYPRAGQTKDTAVARGRSFWILVCNTIGAPGFVTLTAPGVLFGQGLSSTGMSVFRNTLYVNRSQEPAEIPFDAFLHLALSVRHADDAAELAMQHQVRGIGHLALSDGDGETLGLELDHGTIETIRPRRGIYVHANHAVGLRLRPFVDRRARASAAASRSVGRDARLRELIAQRHGRLTTPLLFRMLADHDGHPLSLCCHRSARYRTVAALVAEPTLLRLTVSSGAPCTAEPVAFDLSCRCGSPRANGAPTAPQCPEEVAREQQLRHVPHPSTHRLSLSGDAAGID